MSKNKTKKNTKKHWGSPSKAALKHSSPKRWCTQVLWNQTGALGWLVKWSNMYEYSDFQTSTSCISISASALHFSVGSAVTLVWYNNLRIVYILLHSVCMYGYALTVSFIKKWSLFSMLKRSLSLNSGCLSTLRRTTVVLSRIFFYHHMDHKSHLVTPRNKHGSLRCTWRTAGVVMPHLLTSVYNLIPSQHISGRITRAKTFSVQTAGNVRWESCTHVSKGHGNNSNMLHKLGKSILYNRLSTEWSQTIVLPKLMHVLPSVLERKKHSKYLW